MVEGAPTAPPAAGAHEIGLGAVVRYAVQLATQLPTAGSRRVRLGRSRRSRPIPPGRTCSR